MTFQTLCVINYFVPQKATTGTERKAFGKKENLHIEDAYQIDQTNESVELCDDNDNAYIVNFTEMKKYFKVDPSDCVKVMRKEKLKGTSILGCRKSVDALLQ